MAVLIRTFRLLFLSVLPDTSWVVMPGFLPPVLA